MALVSVIVPTFNRQETLLRALDSVVKQTFSDWELLVIDDGSTDHTEAELSRWLKSFHGPQRVLYKKTSNSGVSRARNVGAGLATGPWLAFLDSDDEWLADKLERQLALKEKFSLIHGEEIWIRNSVRVNPGLKHKKSGGRIFTRCVELCCISPSAVLLKRNLFDEMGGFREDFPVCEDYDLWLKICSRHDVGFVSEPVLIKYGGHDDQLSRRYHSMDYYRVRALLAFLSCPDLSAGEQAAVHASIVERSAILAQGYRKHGHLERLRELDRWMAGLGGESIGDPRAAEF